MVQTLIYSHTGLTAKQIGLTTEIIEGLVTEDREMKVLLCNNVLHNCYFNRTHNILGCASCQSRQRTLLKQAGLIDKNLISLEDVAVDIDYDEVHFATTEELMNHTYEGIDIGRGVASSIISYYRDLDITSEKYQELITVEIDKAITVVENLKSLYKKWKFEEIYLFNGRFAEAWPVIRFAELNSIPYHTMEAGAHDRYELFDNALPHSMKARQLKIEKYWCEADKSTRSSIGNEWFTNRKGRVETTEKSFTKTQILNQLPTGFDLAKRNICIFNSSEDEMASISEYQNDIYITQNDAIKQILTAYKGETDFQFYLRLHPNLAAVDNSQTKEIYNFKFPNLHIIKPNEKIDTYALMDACEKTISFGSSTGIEATYWGKPSILYGNAFYMYLDCVYQPKSIEELKNLVDQKDLTPKPKESTLSFGHFMMTFGQKPINFKFDGLNNSSYKNKKIKKFYPSTLLYFFKYLKKYGHWKSLHRIYYGSKFTFKSIFDYK